VRALDPRHLAELVVILRTACRSEVMPRWRRLAATEIRRKSGPLDLVTVADEAAERVITQCLERLFPGCLVVGEEASAADPSLLGRLGDAELAFVVDPIDGTANYAAGLPLFGSMLAAIACGEIIAAAIHDPVGDDTAVALRGEGAWIEQADGVRRDLRVAAPVPVAQMSGAMAWRHLGAEQRPVVCRNMQRVAASFDLRCAAHSYRLAAAGHCHYLLFNRILPWDHAPGWLLHREAGGYAARLDGRPYLPAETAGGLLCAPDAASWEALLAALLHA
jgi:fructose-1,6-bisphosphatase/inositol monophosphatase family enzyme